MLNKIKLLLSCCCITTASMGQIGTGEWRIHSQSLDAKDVVSNGNVLYAAFDAALLEYDAEYKELSTWDVTNGLSDIKLTSLGVHEGSGSVFIGYENGNIDQIQNGQAINIPGIKLATVIGSKRIHSIKSKGSYTYFATGLGIVKVDPVKHEIKDTYYPNASEEEIIEITFKGDSIYALTKTRMYKGNLNNPALADSSQWVLDTRLPIISDSQFEYKDIECWNDSLYYQKNYTSWGNDSVFVIRPGGNAQIIDLQNFGELISLQLNGNNLVMNGDGLQVIFNDDYSFNFFLQEYTPGSGIAVNAFVAFDDLFWYADARSGLMRRRQDGTFEQVLFKGPSRNTFFSMDWHEGVLAVVPGAVNGNSESYFRPGIMYFEDEEWSGINNGYENSLWKAVRTWDKTSVSINPKNTNQVALGGFSTTPLSLVDKENAIVTDTFSTFNAPFTRFINGSVFLSSLTYDDNGNLWVANAYSIQPLKMLSADGQWYSFNLGSVASNKQTKKLFYDYNGNLWLSVANTGLIGYNPGSSATSSSDDKTVLLNSGEFTGALPSNNVTAIAMDFDEELWIGTDSGFGILYNSENAFDASTGSYNIQRPKIDVNGEVDYILGSLSITDIEVDGGNRKWFGTANSGVILLSDDGLSIVKHYTMDNSPLVSNSILDIEIDHKTGEVFIVTDKGLMSYRGDATYEDAEYSDVKIFPNPARPDFDGLITIQGIRFNSDVKITDVAGNVVYRTTSNGGTATWDGKTTTGEKVASGVYLIWTASNINKGRFVGKVVVAN